MQTNTTSRCEWCGQRFVQSPGPGRKRKYCRRSHRQRHFEARRMAAERGLDADHVVWRRSDLEKLRDAVYILESVVEDARTDLADDRSPEVLADVTDRVLDAVEAVLAEGVGPVAVTE